MATIGSRFSADKGLNQLKDGSGFSVESNPSNLGFSPFAVDSVLAMTANATLVAGNAGVITLSGSATALTGTMPVASSAPGALFCFRNKNASVAHQLTSSQEAAGATVFTDGFSKGAKVSLASGADRSIMMMCDGVNYMILGGTSGSFALSGGAGSFYTIS